jgi:hypothetical protein
MPQNEPEQKPKPADRRKDDAAMPPAGPHAREELTDYEKTPGAGSLPDEKSRGGETDAGTS